MSQEREDLATLITFAVKSAIEKMDADQLRILVTDAYVAVRERAEPRTVTVKIAHIEGTVPFAYVPPAL